MIWFTSDQHFGHKNVIQYCNRPFASVEEMNEEIVRRYNEVVGDLDTVYHLGDVALCPKKAKKYVARLNGLKCLVPGNHDLCHQMHIDSNPKKWSKAMADYVNVGNVFISSREIDGVLSPWIDGEEQIQFMLSHFPFWSEGQEDYLSRYKDWRPIPDQGEHALLHGHVHNAWRIKRHEETGKIMINVGVDVNDFRPISLDEVIEIYKSAAK